MEVLQTIWNALTSENEIAMTIISIPCTFIEIYFYMLLIVQILNIDTTKRKKLVFVVIFSIISILNTYFEVPPFNNFINMLSIPILVLLIFKTNILKAILSEILIFILGVLSSGSIAAIYPLFTGVTPSDITYIPIHRLCVSILMYILLYLIYRLLKHFNINITLIDKFKRRISVPIIINFIIGSIAIGVEYYLLFNYMDVLPTTLVFFNLAILLLYFLLSIFSLIRTNKLEITTQNLEEQKLYNKHLTTLHDNIRGFKHDFNNIVQAIGGFLTTDNIDGLKAYYKDLLEECQINNNLAVLNPELINNPVIYTLLSEKYSVADEMGIKLNLEVLTDLSNLNIKTYELARIFGILLDNAIEAASKCEDNKAINITFRKDKNRHKDLIIIQNTYTNKDINIDKIFEKGYSSKIEENTKENHGLGLWEVRKYLKKNINLDLYTTKTDEYFTQQFEIYN